MVVAYDRRGYTRSVLDRAQDYVHGLETDADDARRLIEHLSDKPAVVFGTMPVVGKIAVEGPLNFDLFFSLEHDRRGRYDSYKCRCFLRLNEGCINADPFRGDGVQHQDRSKQWQGV
jgi:hypothetical protein